MYLQSAKIAEADIDYRGLLPSFASQNPPPSRMEALDGEGAIAPSLFITKRYLHAHLLTSYLMYAKIYSNVSERNLPFWEDFMKKNIFSVIAFAIVCAMLAFLLASCRSDTAEEDGAQQVGDIENLEAATDYIEQKYSAGPIYTKDSFDVLSTVEIDNATYNIAWSTNDTRITVSESAATGYCTVVIPNDVSDGIHYILTATVTDIYGNEMQVSFERAVPFVNEGGITCTPQETIAYKLYISQANLGKSLYAISTTKNDNGQFIESTDYPVHAADFYVEEAAGGFKIYTHISSRKIYIYATAEATTDGTVKCLSFSEENASIFEYDAETNFWRTTIDGEGYVLGTYSTYNTLCISETSWVTAENSGVEQFPAEFMLSSYAEAIIPAPDSTLTIPEANKLGASISIYTDRKYYVSGTITAIENSTYGNMSITDDDGNVFRLYGTYSEDGSIRFDKMDPQPRLYDTITVYGAIGNYQGSAQMKDCRITELTVSPEYKLVRRVEAGVPYKLGLLQATAGGEIYYFDGKMHGMLLSANRIPKLATDVYLEAIGDAYYLYTYVDGNKTYINMVADCDFVDPAFDTAPTTTYYYDSSIYTLIATVNGKSYWFGAVKDAAHTNIGACEYSVNNFYCQFYSATYVDIPDPPVIIPPDGSIDNPFIIDTIPYSTTHENIHDFYYKYTADKDITIILEYPERGYILGLPDSCINDTERLTYTFTLKAGESIKLNLFSSFSNESHTYTFREPEVVTAVVGGDGSEYNPYVAPELAKYLCKFDAGWSAIWYCYTVSEDGFITVDSSFDNAWIQIGLDATSAANNSNDGSGESVQYIALAGQTVMIGIGNWGGDDADIIFEISFEAAEFGEASFTAGNWTGTEVTTWGDTVSYMMVVYEDGTGIGFFDAGYGRTHFDITSIFTANDDIVFKTVTTGEYGGSHMDVYFKYSVEDGVATLTSEKGLYWSPTVLTPYYGLLDEELWNDDWQYLKEDLMIGYTSINAENIRFTYIAEENGSIKLIISTVLKGDVTITYTINGGEERTIPTDSTVTITLLKNDILRIMVIADGYASFQALWDTESLNEINCDFSAIESGVQYKDETVSLGEYATLSTHNSGCYIHDFLRIYDGAAGDGYAIIEVDGSITRFSINAGYKMTELAIYGSADGSEWTLVKTLSISEAYKDYTVFIDTDDKYSFLMLDAVGAQVRIASIDIYFNILQSE